MSSIWRPVDYDSLGCQQEDTVISISDEEEEEKNTKNDTSGSEGQYSWIYTKKIPLSLNFLFYSIPEVSLNH